MEIERITELAKQAIGFSSERGDSINVVKAAFTKESPEPELPVWEQPQFLPILSVFAKWTLVLLLVALVYFGFIRPLMKQVSSVIQKDQEEKRLLAEQQRAQELEQQRLEEEANKPSVEELRNQRIEAIRKQAIEDPKLVGALLKAWMGAK